MCWKGTCLWHHYVNSTTTLRFTFQPPRVFVFISTLYILLYDSIFIYIYYFNLNFLDLYFLLDCKLKCCELDLFNLTNKVNLPHSCNQHNSIRYSACADISCDKNNECTEQLNIPMGSRVGVGRGMRK